jgi:hypothetical protein
MMRVNLHLAYNGLILFNQSCDRNVLYITT